jgi:hypothetical protein
VSLKPNQPGPGTQHTKSVNPTQRAGRPDGQAALKGDERHTTYRDGKSVSTVARTGRPDVRRDAPQRSYEKVTGGAGSTTDVSAGRVVTSKEH